MRLADLVRLNEARKLRRRVVTVTNTNSGDQIVLLGAELDKFESAGKTRNVLENGFVDEEGGLHFVNVYLPPPRIVVIGAVHVSQSLAAMAHLADFDVLIIDPRTAFATPDRFQNVEVVAEWPEDVLRTRPLDPFTAVVALSHDPKIDDFAVASGLRENCFYVGALGSRKTHTRRLERLAEHGLSEAVLSRIRGPVGLDIGAKTPAEIAVAVLAEVIKAWRLAAEVTP